MDATRSSLLSRVRDFDDETSWSDFDKLYRHLLTTYAMRRGRSPFLRAFAVLVMTRCFCLFSREIRTMKINDHNLRIRRFRARQGKVVLVTSLTLILPWVLAISAHAIEPNDVLLSATDTGLVGPGTFTTTDAFLGDGDWVDLDVDIYFFEMDDATTPAILLRVELSASPDSSFDPFLRVFDASGAELVNNDDRAATDRDSFVHTYLFAPGTYYVGVSASENPFYDNMVAGDGRSGNTGEYTLTITTQGAFLPVSAHEPNDQAADATLMGSGTFKVAGEFIGDGEQSRADVDTYLVNLTAPARVDIEVLAEAIDSTLDPVVWVRMCAYGNDPLTGYGACGMSANDDSLAGSVDSALSLGIPEPTSLYIMVAGAGNRRHDPGFAGPSEPASVGPYALIARVTYVDGQGPDEPNDSIPMAVRLTPFVINRPEIIELDGYLGDGPYAFTRGDRDFYEVRVLGQNKTLTVDVSPAEGSGFEPVVAAFDVTGRILAKDASPDASGSVHIALPAACSFFSDYEADGVFVMIMGTRQRFPNDPFVPWPDEYRFEEFQLEDSLGSTGGYHVTITVGSDDELCGEEPNDTIGTATQTGLIDEGFFTCTGGILGDSLCDEPGRDADIWEVHVGQAPALLRGWISTCGTLSGDDLEASLYLHDSQGNLVEYYLYESFYYDRPGDFEFSIQSSGEYYLAIVAEQIYYEQFDPTIACSTRDYYNAPQEYSISVILTQGTPGSGIETTTAGRGLSSDPSSLFAARMGESTGVIDAVNPDTGETTTSFNAPEPYFGGSEGLAFDGDDLYFLGVGRYPALYQLDTETGDIIDEYILWQGSGFYSDAVMLAGELFLLDFYDRSVHVIDPQAGHTQRTLRVGALNGITTSGGLGALAGPDRLYVSDAFNTGKIYEVDPQTGMISNTLTPAENRPVAFAGMGNALLYAADWLTDALEVISTAGNNVMNLTLDELITALAGSTNADFFGDFDGDRDVDLVDVAAFQLCYAGPDGEPDACCEPGDIDGNNLIDARDFANFPAVTTGPNMGH
ncbi:MAG: pre-peptidase C-terminal domain-containing protein [Phycisphaerales bacterium]|nr:MAG: pre-peptidase C-terminal domain-containing protein [Phycisphaerales bacterium]